MSQLALLRASRLPDCEALLLADKAKTALLTELRSWPKPGLVSHIDQGSHSDMDWRNFVASATAITPYFACLAREGAIGANMRALRAIGIEAELAMLAATGGVNTHRGAIFALGLLCAAAGSIWSGQAISWSALSLCEQVRQVWGEAIRSEPVSTASHGAKVQARYGAGGARAEAAAGFPRALTIGVPALREGRCMAPQDPEAARIHAFFSLLAVIEDSNLLHRGGRDGLAFAQKAATRFLMCGSVGRPDWRTEAAVVHGQFIARRLSPGGSADLLAISLFLDALESA